MQDAWLNGLLGGLLIGISAAIYLLADGRIAGTSGIAIGRLASSRVRCRIDGQQALHRLHATRNGFD